MFNTLSAATFRFLADLSNLQGRLIVAQRQVSSGLRLQEVSDSPDQVSDLLQLKANIAHNTQLKYNLGHVQAEVNSAESAINSATVLMDRARQIAAQANNSTTTVETRSQLGDQVKGILTQVLGLVNTNVEGRFVFSGSADQAAPYAGLDLTTSTGVGTYNGGMGTRMVEHPNGSTFPVSLTAEQIFDGGPGGTGTPAASVLQSLTALYNDLKSNNIAGLTTDVANIATASSYLSGQQAQYGEMQNQVADAVSFQQKLDTQLQAQRSNVEDADAVAAITTLQQETLGQQAALQAHASMPTKSLFDFIG
jgi:flagellar hook-associated protein 3 FlgL